jgi:Protein of unknown function (DUF5132)
MPIFEDEQRTLIIGLISGLAAAGVVKHLAPALSDTGRPLLKGLIKVGLIAFETSREKLAQAGEIVEDLFAEARAELESDSTDAAYAGVPHSNGGA